MLGAAVLAAAALAIRAELTPDEAPPNPGGDAGHEAGPTPTADVGLDPDLVGYEEPNGCVRLAETATPGRSDPPLPVRACRIKCSKEFVEEEYGYECVECLLMPVYDGSTDDAGHVRFACQQRFDASWTHRCDHLLTKGTPYELWCRQRNRE